MSAIDAAELMKYLQNRLEFEPVVDLLEAEAKSSSSRHKEWEGIFTRRFLCPAIERFFNDHLQRPELNLSDRIIREGLGMEGFEHNPAFSFSPARKKRHLFTKSEVIKASAPRAWLRSDKTSLTPCYACPDFAIKNLLNQNIVGEVKYFRSDSKDTAIRELYNASRQALFYLGAFHGEYDSALIVVADASKNHSFFKGLDLIKEDLLKRFGADTNIHLLPIKLKRGAAQESL